MVLFFLLWSLIFDIAYRFKGKIILFAITLFLIGREFYGLISYHVQENTKTMHARYDLNVGN